jgi:peptidoglycan hydrolase CwlO-like protein
MAANHQNIISEKDKQLAEFQKQIENLQRAESELSKQIDEQKAKNNVSKNFVNFPKNPKTLRGETD